MLNKIKQYMAANLGISDDETVTMLFESFSESCDRHLESLHQAISTSDWESIRINAHTIKGCAANIGADEIYQTALSLENAAKQKSKSDCPELLKTLRQLCNSLK